MKYEVKITKTKELINVNNDTFHIGDKVSFIYNDKDNDIILNYTGIIVDITLNRIILNNITISNHENKYIKPIDRHAFIINNIQEGTLIKERNENDK